MPFPSRFPPSRRFAFLLLIGMVSAFPSLQARESFRPLAEARAQAQAAAQAYRSKDFKGFLDHATEAHRLHPDHPRYLYNLACALALTGDGPGAARRLDELAAMGLAYPAAADQDFAAIATHPTFRAVVARFEANRAATGVATVALRLVERGLVTESIAYDPATGDSFISSVRKRKIVRVDRTGRESDFSHPGDGLFAVLGMKVDARRRVLWACIAAIPQMEGFQEADRNRTGIVKYDLSTGKLLARYLLPTDGKEHLLGDLAMDRAGNVFATDSLAPVIYRIANDAIEPFLTNPGFGSLQGLDFSPSGDTLYVADYAQGIFAVSLKTRAVSLLRHANNIAVLGIDGLYVAGNDLIAVQNGITPNRVVRLKLVRDRIEHCTVLAANLPNLDEPTLGVVAGKTFHFIANSQWGNVDDSGKIANPDAFKPTTVLSVSF